MIRHACKCDLDSIYTLICNMEQVELDYHKFKKIFLDILTDEHFFCFVFEKDNLIIGCLNLRIEYQLHHVSKIAEIMELSVAENYRSCGIGKQLFSMACKVANEQGCSQIEVCCNKLRIHAHRFYEREGMKRYHYKFTKKISGSPITDNKLGI